MEWLQIVRAVLAEAGIVLKPEVTLTELITVFGLPLLAIYSIYRYLYTHFTSKAENRAVVIPWLESKLIEKYRGLVSALLTKIEGFYGPAHSAQAFSRSLSLAFAYPIFLFLIAYSFFTGSHEFGGFNVFPAEESGRLTTFWVTLLIVAVIIILMVGSDWLDAKARKPFQHLFSSEKLQDISYRIVMAALTAYVSSTYSADWKVLLLMCIFGYWLGAYMLAVVVVVAVAAAFVGAVTVTVAFAVAFAVAGTGQCH